MSIDPALCSAELPLDDWTRRIFSREMPMVENPDGTLWIEIDEISEVDSMRTHLTELGRRMTALVPDPTCDAVAEEVEWVDLYPKIVPRNGPEPGIVVQPTEIPEGHSLLLAVHKFDGARTGARP